MAQNPTVRVITATEAQNRFGAILKRTYAAAEHQIIERDGIPVAALIPIADYNRLVPASSDSEARTREMSGQLQQAQQELDQFLDRVHARMPEVSEAEANRMIDRAVRQVREARGRYQGKARSRKK